MTQPSTGHVIWRVIGQSVRGASHVRAGLPNQDAIRWLPRSRQGSQLILAVSDGHGSAKSFRSDVGSHLAVDETAWLIQDLLDGQPDPRNLSAVKRTAEDRLPQEIVRRWQSAVDDHRRESPFTLEELDKLQEQRGAEAVQEVQDHPRLAYGATILAVLVAEEFFLFLQLGDGDILTVMGDGEVLRPLDEDARLFANETTSLCMTKAWREMRFRFQARYGPPPAMIMLSTDGYSNSFVNDAAFCQVGSDILAMMRSYGVRAIERDMASWLTDASAAGSGDDITLGILYRPDVVNPAPDSEDAPVHALEDAPKPDQEDPQVSSVVDTTSARRRVVDHIKQEGPREPTKKFARTLLSEESGVLSCCSDEANDPATGAPAVTEAGASVGASQECAGQPGMHGSAASTAGEVEGVEASGAEASGLDEMA
jgi:serine/threonine protein phosphatase PrpC